MDSSVDITSYGHGAFKVIVVAALLIVMQILMVGGRFVSRKMRKVPLAADDYVLLIATILTLGLCALALTFPRIAGIGAPIATTQSERLSEGKILGQSFMAWLILYGLSIALSKCAILLLYVRVFTTSNKAFTAGVFVIGFVVIATGIANTFVAIFQCSPIAYEWNKSIQGGNCIDVVAFARYMTIPNVVTGAIMLIMPLPLSWKLNLTVSARIALTATFLHGIIGFVASCARLTIFFRTNTANFTNNTSLIWTIWTINEPANYIIAACLPTLRPIFQRVLPGSFFILSNGSKRSAAPRRPGSEVLLSPGGWGWGLGGGGGGWDGRGRGRWSTRQCYFPWMTTTTMATTGTGTHGSLCGECWVDVEGARGSVGDGGEQRVAAMRAPGAGDGGGRGRGRERERGGAKDEVVVETMIQVC